MERATAQVAEAELAGLLVTPGSDLAYLTGYGPLPLERMTLLVLVPGRAPVLLVPELERPAALMAPGADALEVLGWAEGEDPYEAAARLLPAGRLAISDQAWASHVLGLQKATEDGSFTTAGDALPLLRAVKDPDELAALRAVGGADLFFAHRAHFFLFFNLFLFVNFGAQNAHCRFAVGVLRAAGLRSDGKTRWFVDDAHRCFHFIDILSAGAG